MHRITAAYYARDFLLLDLTIISSAVSSPFFTFSTTVLNAKPSLGSESIKRLRSAIGARVSYCLSSSGDTSKVPASFTKISSEGNRLPSSMSERKGEEIPILFANPRKMKKSEITRQGLDTAGFIGIENGTDYIRAGSYLMKICEIKINGS